MMLYVVLGIILAAIGSLGILLSSSLFFGFLTSGVFLIAYTLFTQQEGGKGETQASQAPAPTSPPPSNPVSVSFCSNCGAKLEYDVQICPFCGKKLGGET